METEDPGKLSEVREVLEAEQVYVLMSNDYRISRNRRAEWFFSLLNTEISLLQKSTLNDFTKELEIISVIPKNAPSGWTPRSSHLYHYRISSATTVNFLARKYRIVYCLDISSSVASVDVQAGLVMFEGIYEALQSSMRGLIRPFYVPGSLVLFQPRIYASVIAHAPFLASISEQVLIQGILLSPETIRSVIHIVFDRLTKIETKVAEITASISNEIELAQTQSDRLVGQLFDEERSSGGDSAEAMGPDFGFVDLLRQALIGLQLLPENSTAGLIVVTDGVISVPDGGYLDAVLSQLRYNTVSCSFMQLSSPFHPHLCYGVLPYADLMRFISGATFGAFLTSIPEVKEDDTYSMNIYHSAFLSWSFQKSLQGLKMHPVNQPSGRPGEWSVRNKCFFKVRDMPIVKKLQYETSLPVDYLKILSCRLREGFILREVNIGSDNTLEIRLTLPWKFLIQIEYLMTTNLREQKVKCAVWLEGPYDFLHDVTCLAKKPFQSYYRQLMVSRFWASQKNLSESDKLLVHFNSFSTNPSYYNIPDSLRNGIPLFYISPSSSAPVLMSNDFGTSQTQFAQFAQFWKPVCLLDTTIWQKWMHTHSIGIILEHDHPLPKSLHLPNTSGRYNVIQCRQSVMALNTLLKDWSSFVLVENHSYVKFIFNDSEKPPSSFYVIRVTSKPPCVVLRLAFLVGAPGHLRHEEVVQLREKISLLTSPQRLKEPTEWRNASPVPSTAEDAEPTVSKGSFASSRVLPCCNLLHKPIEKILIRYERVPRNLFRALLPQNSYNNLASPKAHGSQPSTFGFRPTFPTPWGSSNIKMGPEMFNTVSRYLHHRRWIWCVQSSASSPLSQNCASQILSTITKIRLQEGFRFANSGAGTVNLVLELSMNVELEKMEEDETELGNGEELEGMQEYDEVPDLTPCVLQYVIFPPVTSLESNSDDEDEGEVESVEGMGELYLVTECWIEPQYGRVVGADSERNYMNGLEYFEVPNKIFEIDRECISALVTFEHLNLMCRNDKVPSPTHLPHPENRAGRHVVQTDNIKSIPFAFELNRILPKSQQSEILLSVFNQDLSVSFPVNPNHELSNYCDQANRTLYEAWSQNVSRLHDREVLLADDEHETILNLLIGRERATDVSDLPIVHRTNSNAPVPKWRCFIKGITHTHVIVTLMPASYHDVKILMLSHDNLAPAMEGDAASRSVSLLQESLFKDVDEKPMETPTNTERSFDLPLNSGEGIPMTSTPIQTVSGEGGGDDDVLIHSEATDKTKGTLAGRKRSRVKSGGESGPLAKRLNRKNSFKNAFRFRVGSMDTNWKNQNNIHQRSRTKSADDKHLVDDSLPSPLYRDCSRDGNDEQLSYSGRCIDSASQSENQLFLFPDNHMPKYGSITLPVFCYECSLNKLIEHVIRRSASCKHDLYLDRRRVGAESPTGDTEAGTETDTNATDDNEEGSKPRKLESPKVEESDPSTISSKLLKKHCSTLELAWTKSYIHGLFESLQNGYFIHHKDINVAMTMCQRFQVDVDLTEFITTICGHFRTVKQKEGAEGGKIGTDPNAPSTSQGSRKPAAVICRDMTAVHGFIKKRFRHDLLLTFDGVTDQADVFYFKLNENQFEMKSCCSDRPQWKDKVDTVLSKENAPSVPDSSKNTSEFDEVESLTVKAESACSDALRVPSKEDISRSPEFGSSELLYVPDFIVQTMEDGSEVEHDLSSPVPLFLYLTCCFKYKDFTSSFVIHDVPTCLDEFPYQVKEALAGEDVDPSEISVTAQFVFLTVPPEMEEVEKGLGIPTSRRTISVCSTSSLPNSKEEIPSLLFDGAASIEPEKIAKMYPNLPTTQLLAVKKTVDDVKWLLRDEVTSFRWEAEPLTENTLDLVSQHVQRSAGKNGCQLHVMPLTFVNNSYPLGFEKFKDRFRSLTVEGFRLKEEGNWFYLVCTSKSSLPRVGYDDLENVERSFPGGVAGSKDLITEDMLRESVRRRTLTACNSDGEDAEEIVEMREFCEQNNDGLSKPLRKISGTVGNQVPSKASSLENLVAQDCDIKVDCTTEPQRGHRVFLATPSQMSEISSLVGSVITNEEGYDGDGSDSDGDEDGHTELESAKPKLPPFWMIFQLNAEQMMMYFHCRYNEDDLTIYKFSNQLREKIFGICVKLRKIVNQDLLLQQLDDTRQCSPLLEPDNEEADMWEGREVSISAPPPSIPPSHSEDTDFDYVSQATESAADFTPGTFSCNVVWQTKFTLHSRLRTGPGKSLLSRGIQTLQATLIPFEVTNRKNMFVYKDSCGNVFYLRLYRMQEPSASASPNFSECFKSDSQSDSRRLDLEDPLQESRFPFSTMKDHANLELPGARTYSEDVVLLQVHGITEAGPEIKEQLVQSLRNKLDDSVLDILSVTLDRNPHCKLTPEDVHFIQKPFTPPDVILKYALSPYATQYLAAFSYYLHQNLLQFLHIPKYTDFRPENHFQDYSRYGEERNECTERNIYMYIQSPGGTGNRGIACLAITLIDSKDTVIRVPEACRPSVDSHKRVFSMDELIQMTATDEIPAEGTVADVALELRMWKQGRINVDLLKTYFSTAIKHCMWDLLMEFYFLTAPLSTNMTARSEVVSASEPTTPMISVKCSQVTGTLVPYSSSISTTSTGVTFDSKEFMRTLERRNSANLPPLPPDRTTDVETPRVRSMSVSAKKPGPSLDARQLIGRAPSPLTLSQSHSGGMLGTKGGKYQVDPVTMGLSRYDSGDGGALHNLYAESMKDWCEFGSSAGVPSLRIVPIKLLCRHDTEIIAQEVEKIVQSVAPDNTARQYWKVPCSGGRSFCFTAGSLRMNGMYKQETSLSSALQYNAEVKKFKMNVKKLKELEKVDEAEYPAELLELFKSPEDFNPALGCLECIITARNLVHWKVCVNNEPLMETVFMPEVPKNNYKFAPLMAGGSMDFNLFGGSPSSNSLDKMSRVSSTNGLASLPVNETDMMMFNNPLLVPRQRFLLAFVNNAQVSFVFYNWSKESSDRLVEHTKCLALWLNARAALLSSLLAQKSGIFVNQAIQSSTPLTSLCTEGNPFTCGGIDVDVLIRNHAPPKEYASGRLASLKKAKSSSSLTPFLEAYRNIKHASLLKESEADANLVKAHGEQLLQNKMIDKPDSHSALFQYWLQKGPSAANMIGAEAIETFKQTARIVHYCMTPIIFLPRWRVEVAATRDSTIGTMKKPRAPVDTRKMQQILKVFSQTIPPNVPTGAENYPAMSDTTRSRHNSGTSQRSLESNKPRSRSSIWPLWGNSSSVGTSESQSSQSALVNAMLNAKKLDEKWHTALCESFIQEYIQYLQTLAFIPVSTKNGGRKRAPSKKEETERNRNLSGASFTSIVSSGSSQSGSSSYGYPSFGNYIRRTREESGEKTVHYLHKSLPGGILLFEVGMADPFFYAKLYALEATRIQKKKARKVTAYQNVLAFLDECDKIKVSMHLHSFTYDFHLRSIHSYLSGRQLIFKQGYHLTNFLDDFIKYYPKGPSFARNTVHMGMVTVQNVSTPSHILYNYILSHEKLYKMKVIRMTLQHPEVNEVVNEYILTQISSKKVTYKDLEDESQCDEFDLTLVIAHDTPPFVRPYSVDPSVLRLKYYIVLTSRRELYPKSVEEKRQGKLCVVNTPEALVKSKNPTPASGSAWIGGSKPNSRRPSLTEAPLLTSAGSNSEILQPSPSLPGPDKDYTDGRSRKPSADRVLFEGIREEQVNYMGYFSSHEQMMQTIVQEQVAEVEKDILVIVEKASIDCRRDLLWQRLLVGGQMDDKGRNRKEDLTSRETSGALSYWEFTEMLELVHVKSLTEMDPRLKSLLNQPMNFYQNLLRLLTIKHDQNSRYFVAPDRSTHQMAIFSPHVQQSVVMLDINVVKPSADLSIVFKEVDDRRDLKQCLEFEADMLNLIESVVNACCYCCWMTLV